MIQETFEISKVVRPRTKHQVLNHLVQEVGELAKEVAEDEKWPYGQSGEDGITGESVDVILCALDLIWLHEGENHIDIQSVMRTVETKVKQKLDKWKAKYS